MQHGQEQLNANISLAATLDSPDFTVHSFMCTNLRHNLFLAVCSALKTHLDNHLLALDFLKSVCAVHQTKLSFVDSEFVHQRDQHGRYVMYCGGRVVLFRRRRIFVDDVLSIFRVASRLCMCLCTFPLSPVLWTTGTSNSYKLL